MSLQPFSIISGENAGRRGPMRATPGCDCVACVEYRGKQAERERLRYQADPTYAERRREYMRERRRDSAYRGRLREYQRLRRERQEKAS